MELAKVMSDLGERLSEEEVSHDKYVESFLQLQLQENKNAKYPIIVYLALCQQKNNPTITIKIEYMHCLISKITKCFSCFPIRMTSLLICYSQVEEMMRWADKDGDGKVGFQEFAALMSVTARGHHSDHI